MTTKSKNAKVQSKVKDTIAKVDALKSKATAKVKKSPKVEVHEGDGPVKKTPKATTKKQTPKEITVAKVKKAAKNNLVEEVISKREVVYIYPEGCDNTLDKKKFRQVTRNKIKNLQAELQGIKDKTSKEYIKKEKAFNAYVKTVRKAM